MTFHRWVRCAVAGCCAIPGYAQSANTQPPMVSPVATLGKLTLALAAVLLIFWLFVRLMKYLQGGSRQALGNLELVGSLAVGQRERLLVVLVGAQQLVLCDTPQQISKLHVLDDAQTLTAIDGDPAVADFRQKLKAALNRQAHA